MARTTRSASPNACAMPCAESERPEHANSPAFFQRKGIVAQPFDELRRQKGAHCHDSSLRDELKVERLCLLLSCEALGIRASTCGGNFVLVLLQRHHLT